MAASTATFIPDSIDLPALGNRKATLINWTGPASYTAVTPGSPPTGGQSIAASVFGLKFLDGIIVLSNGNGGQYGVRPIIVNPGKSTSAILMWFTLATGAELSGTDLSAKSVALLGIGR